jgi:hypothetical protein
MCGGSERRVAPKPSTFIALTRWVVARELALFLARSEDKNVAGLLGLANLKLPYPHWRSRVFAALRHESSCWAEPEHIWGIPKLGEGRERFQTGVQLLPWSAM